MDLGLNGKVALVTGGSMGIGRAIALALAREGVDVAMCARGLEALESAASDIMAETGRRVLPIKADVTELEDIKSFVGAAVSELGGVDILVNNAVNSVAAPFMELPDEAWKNHIEVKVMGYVRCAREVVPHMRGRGGGRIITIGGAAARNVGGLTMSNGVTNAAVSNFTKNLSDTLGRDGILVNCIHPGATRTPRLVQVLGARAQAANISLDEEERAVVAGTPIGRLVEPARISRTWSCFWPPTERMPSPERP